MHSSVEVNVKKLLELQQDLSQQLFSSLTAAFGTRPAIIFFFQTEPILCFLDLPAQVGRGYIDRELVKARRAQRYFLHTITPACILIQSQWRGYTRRRDLAK